MRHNPASPALYYRLTHGGTRSFNFGDMQVAAGVLADELAALGVRRSDRVAIMLPKCPELVVGGLALWKLGAVYVPLFTAFGPDAIAYRCTDAGVSVLITDAANGRKLEGIDAGVRARLSVLIAEPGGGTSPPPAATASGASGFGCYHYSVDSLLARASPSPRGGASVGDELTKGAALDPSDPIALLYTSGTTGTPKGVDIPARSLAAFETYLRLGVGLERGHPVRPAAWSQGQQQADARPQTRNRHPQRYYCTADPGWAYGLYYNLLGPLALGIAPLYLEAHFTAEAALEALAAERITHYTSAPTAYRVIKAAGEAALTPHREAIAAHLRTASSAGEPLNPEVVRWWEGAFGLPIADHYGQTENGMMVNNHWVDSRGRAGAGASWLRPGSMGRSMPGLRAVVLDSQGVEVLGQPGEVAIDTAASPLLWFRGYHDNPAKTAERSTGSPPAAPHAGASADGAASLAASRPFPQQLGRYFLTGDVATHFRGDSNAAVTAAEAAAGFVTADTEVSAAAAPAAGAADPFVHPARAVERFWFRSRADDVITSSGYRIGPFEVESSLMKHAHVAEAAVVGLPDPEGLRGEVVAAFVVLREGVSRAGAAQRSEAERAALARELQAQVKRDLSAHQYPRHVAIVPALPKTPSGKVQRFLLKQTTLTKLM
jgi:acetyl-CoA synthetase